MNYEGRTKFLADQARTEFDQGNIKKANLLMAEAQVYATLALAAETREVGKR